MTKKNINTIGCDNLIDNAFVPEAGQQGARAPEQKNALRQEVGAPLIREEEQLSFSDLCSKGATVTKEFFGTPASGKHIIKVRDAVILKGYDGHYVKFTLVDINSNCCWYLNVSGGKLMQVLATISEQNNGLLAGLNPDEAIKHLKANSFNCWTTFTEKGKLATYFNEDKFNSFTYFLQKKQGEYELRKLREQERKDNEARMAEEAKMGREDKPKAKSSGKKYPIVPPSAKKSANENDAPFDV